MERVLIRFTKGEAVRFVGHLDLMRLFERAMRRSEFPVAFSQGFNPRPRMSFASALALGATSEWELCQLDLAGNLPTHEVEVALDALRRQLPSGITLPEFWEIPLEKRNPYIQPATADYLVTVSGKDAEGAVNSFLKDGPEVPGAIHISKSDSPNGEETDQVQLKIRLPIGERGGIRIRDVVAHLTGVLPEHRVTRLHRSRLYCEALPPAAEG